jgi:NAD(P)-dependent dehydrogenase (short-subunit alcohol dehydrogenase family)
MKELAGKVAVVTGASRGLGRRIAVRLAREGATVALLARSLAGLEEARREIEAASGRALAIAVDLARAEDVRRVKEIVERELGAVSVLVNAAGVFGPIALLKDGTDAEARYWVETLMINTVAPYLTCRAFVGGMVERGWGRVVNVTSAAALHHPGPANSAYGTSKAALNQMTRHLAAELAETGVTANVVHPGDVKTEMWAEIKESAERLGDIAEGYAKWVRWVEETGGDDPEKAAELVADLMQDRASGVNGQFLWIKDGLQAPVASWGDGKEVQPWR